MTEMTNASTSEQSNAFYHYGYLAVGLRANDLRCFQPGQGSVEPDKIGDATVGFEVTCKPTGYLQLGLVGDDPARGSVDVTPRSSSTACA